MKKEISNITMKAYRRRSPRLPDSYNNGKMVDTTRISGIFGDVIYNMMTGSLTSLVEVPEVSVMRYADSSEETVSVFNRNDLTLQVYGDSTNDWIFYGHALMMVNKSDPSLMSKLSTSGDAINLDSSVSLTSFTELTENMMNIVKNVEVYPSKVIYDEMENLDIASYEKLKAKEPAEKPKAKAAKAKAEEPVDFKVDMGKELTEEEKLRIPVIDFGVIHAPEYVTLAAKYLKRRYSRNAYGNILLFGGAGNGKSFSTRILAAMMQVPHYTQGFSRGTDEVTMVAGADVKDGTVSYNDSPLVQCARDGGVIELQEFYNARGGVLTSLNEFLEEGFLKLANGKVIKRHPSCFVVATANIEYEGGQAIDFSVDSRFKVKIQVDDVEQEELIHRIMLGSGNTDKKMVSKMVKAFMDIKNILEKEEHDEGIADIRALEAWAEIVAIGEDPKTAAYKTFLPAISKNKTKMREIFDSYIRNVFE